MPIKHSQALIAALALIAAPAFAQDATPEATPAPTQTEAPAETPSAETPSAETPATPAPADAAPAADTPAATDAGAAPTAGTAPAAGTPAAGTPAAATPADAAETAATQEESQVGQYYAKSTNGEWTTRCIRTDQGKDPCELYQLMKDGQGNSVAEMTLIPLKNGEIAAGATLIAPLETDLIQGLGLGIDNAQPRAYPFSFCAPVGCISRMGFTAAELSALKRGNTAKVSLRPFGATSEEPIQLQLSLSGFTAAFDELQAYADAPAPEAAPAAEAPAAAAAPAEGEAAPAE
ncbi:invasion associated locus B family protein [Paracoccus sp. 11-3]|uniref:Invasion associated locus B family protein n=1 Tax=Paracoccus amoyensis TaxID=2760093 RepID=A0A926JBY0_9RHOB|nr:invasion associated locus B family protein [Paracoccus amoyensis]MBC9245769.1 invasion associated locus B family protein [Paracoccus amoyensis]